MDIKRITYLTLTLLLYLSVASCSDEVEEPKQEGNPTIQIESQFTDVHFGDLLPFEVTVSDNVPLSVLNVNLYFGEEEVTGTTIRTKDNGQYSGTIEVPFEKNIPDGTATLEFVLINTTMKKTTKTVDVPITRAAYPYLILVTSDGSFPMTSTGQPYEYAITSAFPSTELPAYIKTPVIDDKGREIVFGWDEEGGTVIEGTSNNIPFVSPIAGSYTVTFNTKTFEASPFFEVVLNGEKMQMVDKENYQLDVDLTQGEEITLEGLTDWWIDPDFFAKQGDKLTFVPISGKYRITANLKFNYLKVETMSGNDLATLQPDGTGAIWIIGDNIGKPSLDNTTGWDTSKAICMAPIGDKKYRVTLIAGTSISIPDINFKFFHQKGWGGEFSNETLSTNSDLVFIGAGEDPGPGNAKRDPGNLGLYKDKVLTEGKTYVFTIDLSGGNDNAMLAVEEM